MCKCTLLYYYMKWWVDPMYVIYINLYILMQAHPFIITQSGVGISFRACTGMFKMVRVHVWVYIQLYKCI